MCAHECRACSIRSRWPILSEPALLTQVNSLCAEQQEEKQFKEPSAAVWRWCSCSSAFTCRYQIFQDRQTSFIILFFIPPDWYLCLISWMVEACLEFWTVWCIFLGLTSIRLQEQWTSFHIISCWWLIRQRKGGDGIRGAVSIIIWRRSPEWTVSPLCPFTWVLRGFKSPDITEKDPTTMRLESINYPDLHRQRASHRPLVCTCLTQ